MFFHGIQMRFLAKQFPYLNPDGHVSSKHGDQLADRIHLIEKFGLEPVHLLESSPDYPVSKCLKECFSFGDVVLAFCKLTQPIIQLSKHELGVPFLDVRSCHYVFVRDKAYIEFFKAVQLRRPILVVKNEGDSS
ncbi:hypothetical protein [Ammoniphilus sp. 3BR4]|uniref:hypothetical protein n=1 Tax=Ammoniphilus sp. 3BR4 TaxID=3158265 RepID=UPI003466AEC0